MRLALGENAKMALDTLRENKLRSFLTVLGVVIGITALITVSSILVGFYGDVTAYLEDYGPNTIWGFKVAPGVGPGPHDPGRTQSQAADARGWPRHRRAVSRGGECFDHGFQTHLQP